MLPARRLVTAAPIIRSLPRHLQLQLLRSYVVGGAAYMLSLLCISPDGWREVETVLHHTIRSVMDLPGRSTPNSHMQLVSGLPQLRAMVLAAGNRLTMAIHAMEQVHPDAIACRLLRAIVGSGHHRGTTHSTWSWQLAWDSLVGNARLHEQDAYPAPPDSIPEVALAARILARQAAHAFFLKELREHKAGDVRRVLSDTRPRSVSCLHAHRPLVPPTTEPFRPGQPREPAGAGTGAPAAAACAVALDAGPAGHVHGAAHTTEPGDAAGARR